MSPLRVLVVGASIAGPTTAYWLAQTGATVTVIERFPTLRTAGQNVDIRSSAVGVMKRMGVERAVRARCLQQQGWSLVDSLGRSYGVLRQASTGNAQSLLSEYEIYRGDLANILYEQSRAKHNVRYIFGEEIFGMNRKEGSTEVSFKNGTPTSDYDLIVACDGAASRTRSIGLAGLFNSAQQIQPLQSITAYFTLPGALLNDPTISQGHSGADGRMLTLEGDPFSNSTRVMMWLNCQHKGAAVVEIFRKSNNTTEGLKGFLEAHFRGLGWRTDEILDMAPQWTDLYASEWVQVKLPTIHADNFALVGDAGYAPGFTGGGTSLAMIGSYVLAGEIHRHQGNLKSGLAAYEQRMRPVIDDLQKIPPFVPSAMAPETAWGLWIRNRIFSFLAWSRLLEFGGKYLAGSLGSGDKYGIPEYDFTTPTPGMSMKS